MCLHWVAAVCGLNTRAHAHTHTHTLTYTHTHTRGVMVCVARVVCVQDILEEMEQGVYEDQGDYDTVWCVWGGVCVGREWAECVCVDRGGGGRLA